MDSRRAQTVDSGQWTVARLRQWTVDRERAGAARLGDLVRPAASAASGASSASAGHRSRPADSRHKQALTPLLCGHSGHTRTLRGTRLARMTLHRRSLAPRRPQHMFTPTATTPTLLPNLKGRLNDTIAGEAAESGVCRRQPVPPTLPPVGQTWNQPGAGDRGPSDGMHTVGPLMVQTASCRTCELFVGPLPGRTRQ